MTKRRHPLTLASRRLKINLLVNFLNVRLQLRATVSEAAVRSLVMHLAGGGVKDRGVIAKVDA